ncbi:putative methyltransferase-like protein 5-like [Capsicum annuum]|uniref:putative late blight resistance protein homolog R1B-16 n=1 Tax=Capsicum annuum TaxID=4072 RepID=UPI001FB0A01D|nr:putative late blight resistance protein homolog R1B-16 [Capsicum annuum]KAF3622968.1 putative methyltransferase-like protein 5-like [Capsicum annuum]
MAYAAVTSLMNTMQQSMQVTGCNLQSFYKKLETVRAIMETPCYIAGDLEALTSLEDEITQLAYTTQDMVDSESRRVFTAKNAATQTTEFWDHHSLLKQAIRDIDSMRNKWMKMQNRYDNIQDWKAQNLTITSTSQHTLERENMMVGREIEFEMVQDQLARGASEVEVVSIVGMGGIGKTTLANKLFCDPFIVSRFDIRAKVTITQEYCTRNVLLDLLFSISGSGRTGGLCEQQDDGQLADQLQKLLKGRRYLIVIDDIWAKEAWDDIKLCFPDCNCRSRILMTTRNMEVAEYASSGKLPYQLLFLSSVESWNLLYEKVFVKECFSPEFENIGKQIALNCKGLPLTIVVISGLLQKIGKSLDKWKSVAENVGSVVSTDLDVQCMKVLALSYHHLPQHLRACFLYFAIFPVDKLIFVNKLVRLWAAEGFLKVDEMKNMEEVGKECLKDLTDRNLIFIHRVSRLDGKIKACGMHDMIRELCLREARNTNFVNVIMDNQNPSELARHFSTKLRGRISIQSEQSTFVPDQLYAVRNSKPCSLLLFIRKPSTSRIMQELEHFNLLRVVELASPMLDAFPICIVGLFHLRYLALTFYSSINHRDIYIAPSVDNLQYLQTFILKFQKNFFIRPKFSFVLPLEIFKMSALRHLSLDRSKLNRYASRETSWDLGNLQCLSGWNPLYCTSSIFRLFPNLKKLKICDHKEYYMDGYDVVKGLHDLCYLDQLEELKYKMRKSIKGTTLATNYLSRHSQLPPPGAFPQNLKKLAFTSTSLPWEDLRIVGKLPKLEALKLAYDACVGREWKVVEEGFPQLKFLLLQHLGLNYWRASSDHFPRLERLVIDRCGYLDSIPHDFAEITTLQLIDISNCAESVGNSAKKILEEIEDNYGSTVEVCIS